MLKISSIVSWIARGKPVQTSAVAKGMDVNAEAAWRHDPLAHPALRGMSQTELADLPIGHPILCEPSRT